MNAEWALILVTVIGGLGTLFNVWLTLSIKTYILSNKLWVTENFVAKEDMKTYLAPFSMLKDAMQIQQSNSRFKA